MTKSVIFVIGGPGSGKGTQCEKIVKKYGYTHLSTGDLIREEVASGSEYGQRLKKIMESAQLVPLNEVLAMLKNAIDKEESNSNGFLIDGYPREVAQAIEFDKQVYPCSMVIYFDVSDETMTGRLVNRGKTSGRVDDNIESIKKRLLVFHQHSDPILNHYQGKVKIIKAEGTPDDIFAEVSKHIDTLNK